MTASFNPQVLISLRAQLAREPENVAQLLELPYQRYLDIEAGEHNPTSKEVSQFAAFYRVMEQTFFRRTTPRASKRVDFRRSIPNYKGSPGPILDGISFASSVQKLLISVSPADQYWFRYSNRKLTLDSDIELEAAAWRFKVGLSDEAQLDIPSKNLFFNFVRSRIEALGIAVLVDSFKERFFKGLTYGATEDVPVILINSHLQQKSSRTFTLAHEFCHVLLGNDDVSNPYEPDSNVERFCNKFAGAFLIPRSLILSLATGGRNYTANATIKFLANKLKVSMEAISIRLEECGFVQRGFWTRWKAQFPSRLPSEEPEGGGGADTVDQGLTKLASLGYLFASVVPTGYRAKGLTNIALYKASGLKPAYVEELHSAALKRLSEMEAFGEIPNHEAQLHGGA